MSLTWMKHACVLSLLTVPACSGEPQDASTPDEDSVNAMAQEDRVPVDLNEVELPPMVQRSPAYRCNDGNALYVDVLSDRQAVLVRDSRSDAPVRLERSGEDGPFSGDDRTLSGTGSQISYSSPDRPNQTCREARS